jgi:FkbM family methyltransferase
VVQQMIAIEPFPRNYEMARKNIEFNNLSNKIALLLAGCSSCNGSIVVNQSEYRHDMNLTDNRDMV